MGGRRTARKESIEVAVICGAVCYLVKSGTDQPRPGQPGETVC